MEKQISGNGCLKQTSQNSNLIRDFCGCIYRVKSTPKEVWINIYHDESVSVVAYPSEALARDAMVMAGVPTLFRELSREEENK